MTAAYQQVDFVIDQAGPGTTVIVPAEPYHTIRVISYSVVLTLAGTFAWSDGTDWKTGDFPFALNGGIAEAGTANDPLFVCAVGRPLQITTTVGAAQGRVRIEYR